MTKTNDHNFNLDTKKLTHLGLDTQKILDHHEKILKAIKHEINTSISIKEACTLENRGVISWDSLKASLKQFKTTFEQNSHWIKHNILTCIPAAGAASRYFADLERFVYLIEQKNHELQNLWEDFLSEKDEKEIHKGKKYPFDSSSLNHLSNVEKLSELFEVISKFEDKLIITTVDRYSHFLQDVLVFSEEQQLIIKNYCAAKVFLLFYAKLPKALIPTTKEGDLFLALKILEQQDLFPTMANVLIVGQNLTDLFSPYFDEFKSQKSSKNSWEILEQGNKLSTIRFQTDGKPFLNSEGNYVSVSAGHGELLNLFEEMTELFPKTDCIHLRNIDNVIGTDPKQVSEMQDLAQAFYELKKILESLRATLASVHTNTLTNEQNQKIVKDLQLAQFFLNEKTLLINQDSLSPERATQILSPLFGWNFTHNTNSTQLTWQDIYAFCTRPLSIFGMVKKNDNDVGGGPVIAQMPDGTFVKLCLEMSHASNEDKDSFFGSSGSCQFFNPVLVFFELKSNALHSTGRKTFDFKELFDDSFWLLTKREYNHTSTLHHETVLYELLGNSEKTNLVFFEVPRKLFKPHKTFFDSIHHCRLTYGFQKTVQ